MSLYKVWASEYGGKVSDTIHNGIEQDENCREWLQQPGYISNTTSLADSIALYSLVSLFCLIFVVSKNKIFSSYVSGLSAAHFSPWLPAISDIGDYYPSAAIFALLVNSIGILCMKSSVLLSSNDLFSQ